MGNGGVKLLRGWERSYTLTCDHLAVLDKSNTGLLFVYFSHSSNQPSGIVIDVIFSYIKSGGSTFLDVAHPSSLLTQIRDLGHLPSN